MRFELNNTAALKWTEKNTLAILKELRQQCRKEEVLSLAKALNDRDISRKAWYYWREKFKYDDDIQELMDLIEDSIAARLEEGAINKKYNASTVQFVLRHSYGWIPPKEERAAREGAEPVKRELRPDTNLEMLMAGGRVIRVLDRVPQIDDPE